MTDLQLQWLGFADAVASTAHFMARASEHSPLLESVQVRRDEERSVNLATATDRYTVGEQTFGEEVSGPSGWESFCVPRSEVATLVKNGDPATVAVEGPRVTLTYADGRVWSFLSREGDYPQVSRLWTSSVASAGTDAVAFNPALLARFGKVRPYVDGRVMGPSKVGKALAPVRLEFQGALKPARAYIGDRFRALIIPVRIPA